LSTSDIASIEHQVKSIQQLIQHAKFEQAIEQGTLLLSQETHPDHQVELLYLIAVAHRYIKDTAQALKSIEQLIALNPSHSRAYQEQGHAYLAMQKNDFAKKSFERAVELNPCLIASWQELINLYREEPEQMDKVQAAANQLAKLKRLPPALLAVTELMHEGKLLKAEQVCRHFLQNNKRNIEGMCLLAEIGIELKIYDDAEFLLATALELAPENVNARSQYLNLLIKIGKFKAAKDEVENLLKHQPENLSFIVAKANILTGLGDIDNAITLFQQAIESDSSIAGFHLQLGHALKALGNIDGAIVAYQNAYKVESTYGDAYWSLANTKTYRFSNDEIAQMQAHQSEVDLASVDRIQMYFASGKAFEDRKNYHAAFEHCKIGNDLQRE
jgi:tetratricopeptide (TPR) repeat protein